MSNLQNQEVLITKSTGEREIFNSGKLQLSLQKAGASIEVADEIVDHIEHEIVSGMSTSHIYEHAFSLLSKKEHSWAARYSLKRAVADLGPSGFPFEKFLGEVLKAKGFDNVTTGILLRGACAEHEVDVFARKGKFTLAIEAKFHNHTDLKSDMKVALYVHARFADLKKITGQNTESGSLIDEGWLVTNTKFTKNVTDYAECSGLKIISWGYPEYGNLEQLIEEAKLHPLTCLTTLKKQDKIDLLNRGVVLCQTLVTRPELLTQLNLSAAAENITRQEISRLCQ